MQGVHAAVLTHFDDDLKIDREALAAQVERLIAAGIDGVVACGTMGEATSLSAGERAEVLRTVVGAAAGRVPVCAGISAPSAAQAIVHARDAVAASADSLMALPPYLYRADRRELREFFGAIASATALPLMVYNNPEATGIDMQPDLLAELVDTLPTITAIKETSGDARRIADLLHRCGDADVLVGGDDWALEGCLMGAEGWVSGVAVVLPEECVRLWELGSAGQLHDARSLYASLLPLARFDMTSKLVQYFKTALDELGIGGGPCRPPRMPLTDLELERLREALAAASAARATR
jgi:dihydrodipicolinate synthase/N-acetylneuraminate lyase